MRNFFHLLVRVCNAARTWANPSSEDEGGKRKPIIASFVVLARVLPGFCVPAAATKILPLIFSFGKYSAVLRGRIIMRRMFC